MKLYRCKRKDSCARCMPSLTLLQEAKALVKAGELLVYPTDTLYALGTDPFKKKALSRLCELKKRPQTLPISIALPSFDKAERLCQVNAKARILAEEFLPGPLTLVMKKKRGAMSVTKDTMIGIRVPANPLALRLLSYVGPLTATSANIHGKEPPVNIEISISQLGDRVSLYIDCGRCKVAKESTVVEVSENCVKILRKGALSERAIREATDASG